MSAISAQIQEIIERGRKPLGEYEDLVSLDATEKILMEKIGTVFKMPDPGESVIFAWSGGLDSTATAAYLMTVHKVKLYPYFVAGSPRSKYEQLTQWFWIKFFKKRYGDLFNVPMVFYPNDPILRHRQLNYFYPMTEQLGRLYGIWYAEAVSRYSGVPSRTVIYSNVYENANHSAADTLTSFRAFTLLANQAFGYLARPSWMITSLPLERTAGFYLGKSSLVKIANLLELPIFKTRSCAKPQLWHCGICRSCAERKSAFIEAGCEDKTLYIEPWPRR